MKLKITGLILALMFNIAGYCQKQLTLSVDQAVEYATLNNKTMINSGLSVNKAQQALKEAIAHGLPQVDASLDYSNSLGFNMKVSFQEGMPATEIPVEPSSNFNLQVTQLLFSGSYIVGVQTAKLYRELSEINKVKTATEIKAQVTNSYYLVLISKELNKRLAQNLVNLKDLYTKTEAVARVGIIEKNDVDQLFIQVNTVQNAVNASERQLELATNMLRLQLGTGSDTELVLTDTLEAILEQLNSETVLANSLKLENNLDYRLIDQQVNIGKKMVDMRKSAALPTLAGFYSYTYKMIKPNFDMSPPNVVGLKLNLPVFSSGLRSAQTRQAFIDLQTMQNNRDLAADQLRIQDKQLKFNLINATETYNNQKANIEVSRRVYNSFKLKYEQGLISGHDLITANSNYLKSETDYISSALQLLDARIQLDKIYSTAN